MPKKLRSTVIMQVILQLWGTICLIKSQAFALTTTVSFFNFICQGIIFLYFSKRSTFQFISTNSQTQSYSSQSSASESCYQLLRSARLVQSISMLLMDLVKSSSQKMIFQCYLVQSLYLCWGGVERTSMILVGGTSEIQVYFYYFFMGYTYGLCSSPFSEASSDSISQIRMESMQVKRLNIINENSLYV